MAVHIRPIWKFGDGIIGGEMQDAPMNAFHIWWMKQVFTQGYWPWHTPYLYHPLGTDLYWHTLAPIKASMGTLLLPFFDPITSYNLLLLGTFVIVGYSTWLFLRYMIARTSSQDMVTDFAAFAGACVFTLSGYILINVIQHINLLSIEGVPLFLLWYYKYRDTRKARYLTFMALTAFYVSLCEYYYLVYIGLFMALDMSVGVYASGGFFLSRSSWKKPEVIVILKCIAASIIGASPILIMLILHAFPAPINTNHAGSDFPLETLGLIIPGPQSYWFPFLPAFLKAAVSGPAGVSSAGFFVGLFIPSISGYAIWKNIGNCRRYAVIGACFLILSFGPYLMIANQNQHSIATVASIACLMMIPFLKRGRMVRDVFFIFTFAILVDLVIGFTLFRQPLRVMVPLPYILFQNLVPFFGRGGMPCRFVAMTYLMLAVCFSISVATLIRRRFLGLTLIELMVIALFIPSIEFARNAVNFVPYPTMPASVANVIKAELPNVAVFTDAFVASQYEVVLHEHPVSFGRLSRTPLKNINQQNDILHRFLMSADPNPTETEVVELREELKKSNFKYIVLHSVFPKRDLFIRTILNGKVIHFESGLQVYKMYE